ncbi:hypothetical protein PSPO01_15287 [Paraphaeosphaeria sporulosa]
MTRLRRMVYSMATASSSSGAGLTIQLLRHVTTTTSTALGVTFSQLQTLISLAEH